MRTTKNYWLLSLLSILLYASCTPTGGGTLPNGLTGSWKWTNTDGGIADNVHETPASTNKNIELSFLNNNQYTQSVNGVVTSQGTYSTSFKNCIHDGTSKLWVDFSERITVSMQMKFIHST